MLGSRAEQINWPVFRYTDFGSLDIVFEITNRGDFFI